MKIQYASDLHLEFRENAHFLKENPLKVAGEILVLAGDIGHLGDENYSKHPFWDWASENYRQVTVVPGNHEFYKGFDLGTLEDGFDLEIRPNVHAYYNKVVRIDDVDIILSTLWSKIELKNAHFTERCITDFHRIVYKGERFTYSDFNQEHQHCAAFIKDAVEKSDARVKVVVTHHVPSFELNSKDFDGSALNGAFTVELGTYIAHSGIDYWIYGHSHRNIDKEIGDTKCISNQLGYTFHNEHLDFRPDAVIEV